MTQPEWLLAIDPGAHMGWALFRAGKLVSSGHCTKKALHTGKVSTQAKKSGHSLPPDELHPSCVIVGEEPRYRPGRRKGDSSPNDLIKLAVQLGQAVGLYMRKVEVVEFVTPNEWKGSLPKEICHRRIDKVLEADEQSPENHNAKDAVGLGLWRLGRYRK